MKFNVGGFEFRCRMCRRSDRDFVLGLYKKTLFRQVAEYHEPSVKLFDERFYSDYRQKRIIMRGKRRIGMYQLLKMDDKLMIKGLFLSPFYHGKGIGSVLMDQFERYARKKGLPSIQLHVWENNPAVGFYKKLGFSIEAKEEHKYRMVKELV